MGGRGSSSGISEKGKEYGTEFSTLLKVSNIKFVRYNDSLAAKTPQETMTKGRVYATINEKNKVVAISYYDNHGKKTKTIDLTKSHKGMSPHVHHGYEHNENDGVKGATNPTKEEKKLIEFVKKVWLNKHKK